MPTLTQEQTITDVLETPHGPTQSVMAIMNQDGDLKVMWDRSKPDEVAAARAQFNDFRKKGYAAYSLSGAGRKGEVLHDFDPSAESIVMAPPLKGG